MGSTPVRERRNAAVTISLTPSEKEALERIAAEWERSISWTVGRLALRESGQDRSRRFQVVSKHD